MQSRTPECGNSPGVRRCNPRETNGGHNRRMTRPALLAISHGTASPAGQAAVAGLVEGVAARLPDVTVRLGHVDVQQPDVAASLDALPEGQPVVIVPLLLSAGYHVRVDLKEQSAAHQGVAISPALGPDPRLVDALLARLEPLNPTEDDTVVLAVAGSSDDRANEDCRTIGAMLAEPARTRSRAWGSSPRPSHASAKRSATPAPQRSEHPVA